MLVAWGRGQHACVVASPDGTLPGTTENIANIPQKSEAVLVFCTGDDGSFLDAAKVIRKMRASMSPAGSKGFPIIVILLRDADGGLDTPELAAKTGKSMFSAGADDVWALPKEADDFHSTLALSLALCVERRKKASALAAEKAQLQAHSDMFWRLVPTFLQDFPALKVRLQGPPRRGQQIGGSVLEAPLGRGGFGQVFKAVNQDGEVEAVKVVPKNTLTSFRSVESLWDEILWMRRLQHSNIVRVKACLHGQDYIYIIMPMVGKSTIRETIEASSGGKLDATTTGTIFRQCASVIAYCHVQGVGHRDIKHDNFVLSDSCEVTLVDFGLAIELGAEKIQEFCGSMPFVAPEILMEQPYHAAPADMWSLGMLLLEMLCGVDHLPRVLDWPRPLMPKPSHAADLRTFLATPIECHVDHRLGDDAGAPGMEALLHALSATLIFDPNERYEAQEVLRRLRC